MPETLPCPTATELEQFLLGKLAEAESAQVEQHLARCDTCQQAASGLEATDTLVDTVRQRSGPWWQADSPQLEALIGRLLCLPKSAAAARDPAASGKPDLWQSLVDLLAPAKQPGELGRLGRYRILRFLGAGGMGVVFEAEDTQSQQRVAVKVLSPTLVHDTAAVERFRREAQVMTEIVDDHVVSSLDVGQERGVPYLTMPLLRGETLRKRLTRDGVLPIGEVLRIGREMAAGLAAAHERGLLHGDIKPRNVWLEAESNHVKLLDFGLARALRDVAGGGPAELAGTPPYMAPEQGRGRPVDHRADLFSLGCVMYEMCTGQTPFQGETAVGVLMATAADTPKSPSISNPAVPQSLSQLILKLLDKDPNNRHPSASAVIQELAAVERERAITHSVSSANACESRFGVRRLVAAFSCLSNLSSRPQSSLKAVLPRASGAAENAIPSGPTPGVWRGRLVALTLTVLVLVAGGIWGRRCWRSSAASPTPGVLQDSESQVVDTKPSVPAPVVQPTAERGFVGDPERPILKFDESGHAEIEDRLDQPAAVKWCEFTAPRAGRATVTVNRLDADFVEFLIVSRAGAGAIDSDAGDRKGYATVTFAVAARERMLIAVQSLRRDTAGRYRVTVEVSDRRKEH